MTPNLPTANWLKPITDAIDWANYVRDMEEHELYLQRMYEQTQEKQ